MRAAALVPVKDFRLAKGRLSPALDPAERNRLARAMAAHVLAAAAPLPAFVVCDDDAVADFATHHGASVIWTPGLGLNNAVRAGVSALATTGFDRVVVAHSDLPLAVELSSVAAFEGVTLVPDRHDDGTNVLCLPPALDFEFAYGLGSFARHRTQAERLGVPLRVLREPNLSWDIDLPGDLVALGSCINGTWHTRLP